MANPDITGNPELPDGLDPATLGTQDPAAPGADDKPEGADAATQAPDDDLPTDPAELRKGFLRHQDYTRKTMELADQRRELEKLRAEAAEARALALQQQIPKKPQDTPEALPDPSKDPRGYVDAYIRQQVKDGVQRALDSMGLDKLPDQIRPLVNQQKVIAAYQQFAEDAPKLDHKVLAPRVGMILDGTPELAEIAASNPTLAVRLATQIAQAQLDTEQARTRNRSRAAAAPLAAAGVGSASEVPFEATLDQAFRLALAQQGIQPDF